MTRVVQIVMPVADIERARAIAEKERSTVSAVCRRMIAEALDAMTETTHNETPR